MSKNTLKAYNIIKQYYFDKANNDTAEQSYDAFWQSIKANLTFNDLLSVCDFFDAPKANKKIMFECGIIDAFVIQLDYNMLTSKQILGAMIHYPVTIEALIYYAQNIKKIYKMYC